MLNGSFDWDKNNYVFNPTFYFILTNLIDVAFLARNPLCAFSL